VNVETVTFAEGFECVLEGDSGVVVVQEGETAVTTEGDEVKMAFLLVPGEPERHGMSLAAVVALRATAHPSAMKPRMDGAPRFVVIMGGATRPDWTTTIANFDCMVTFVMLQSKPYGFGGVQPAEACGLVRLSPDRTRLRSTTIEVNKMR